MPAAPAVPLTPEIIEEVLDRLSAGESLRSICRDEGMPEITQIMRLRRDNEEFAQQYAGAREMQAEQFYDELIEIADNGTNDWMETFSAEVGDDEEKQRKAIAWRENGEAIRRSVLRVDARKWAMSKILVKRYGDKVTQEHTGEVVQRVVRGDL